MSPRSCLRNAAGARKSTLGGDLNSRPRARSTKATRSATARSRSGADGADEGVLPDVVEEDEDGAEVAVLEAAVVRPSSVSSSWTTAASTPQTRRSATAAARGRTVQGGTP